MDKLNIFTGLSGFFVEKNFFCAELCSTIQDEIKLAPKQLTKIFQDNYNSVVDEETRKSHIAEILEPTRCLVKSRLDALKQKLEAHFQMVLTDYDEPSFLLYKQGDFFAPHKDRNTEENEPDIVKRRKVSVVIFLNNQKQTPTDNAYCGGALTFYGLMRDSRAANYGFPLSGQTGLLVAFPSDIMHEVQPVTWGERYTIVTWFLE